jgi:hypothetical protein
MKVHVSKHRPQIQYAKQDINGNGLEWRTARIRNVVNWQNITLTQTDHMRDKISHYPLLATDACT